MEHNAFRRTFTRGLWDACRSTTSRLTRTPGRRSKPMVYVRDGGAWLGCIWGLCTSGGGIYFFRPFFVQTFKHENTFSTLKRPLKSLYNLFKSSKSHSKAFSKPNCWLDVWPDCWPGFWPGYGGGKTYTVNTTHRTTRPKEKTTEDIEKHWKTWICLKTNALKPF